MAESVPSLASLVFAAFGVDAASFASHSSTDHSHPGRRAVEHRLRRRQAPPRRGVALVAAMALLVVMLGLVAFAVDVGFVALTRTQLQAAADAAALAAASHLGKPFEELFAAGNQFAGYHTAGGKRVELNEPDMEVGIWDSRTRTFAPSASGGNAVRVTARRDATTNGEAPLFFGRIFGNWSFAMTASAVAMANPRDIAFVVDLSGSMNDDTEPCWATSEINNRFQVDGYPTIGTELMQDVFADFGFGSFPGVTEWVGKPLGVAQDKYAYAEMTKDDGPLSASGIPSKYRIRSTDSEVTRKQKAYAWIIDYQLARIMPAAKPTPNSSTSYAYWEKYLDYIIEPVTIKTSSGGGGGGGGGSGGGGGGGGGGGPSPPSPPSGWLLPSELPWYAVWASDPQHRVAAKSSPAQSQLQVAFAPGGLERLILAELLLGATPGTPPTNRGTLPPNQDSDRITKFNNPNTSTFPSAKSSVVKGYRNKLGYLTYVQFMMDFGRDMKPDGSQYSPLSRYSAHCPWHWEDTAGGRFRFPPREQPTHAARRAIIAALQVVKQRNAGIADPSQKDWVSIISYDVLSSGGPVIEQPLTADYDAAMQVSTRLQACGDHTLSTATETGLIVARNHIKSKQEGGQGRQMTNKVVVLLTDGVPNLYSSDPSDIDQYMQDHPNSDFYGGGYYWLDAPLMQAHQMQAQNWLLFPVGVGLGTDYDFMDRMARMGGTEDDDGQSPRGSGNPAEYEQRLTDIFEQIIANPQVRLVQ